MPQEIINIGAYDYDPAADDMPTGGEKINNNFTELYDAIGGIAAREPALTGGPGVVFAPGSGAAKTYIPIDTAPTAASAHLITSGGVKTALDLKANAAGARLTGTAVLPQGSSVRIFNTVAETINTEYLDIKWEGDVAKVMVGSAGTGAIRSLQIGNVTTSLTFSQVTNQLIFSGSLYSNGGLFANNINPLGTNSVVTFGNANMHNQATGSSVLYNFLGTINQSATAGYTGIRASFYETAFGSGTKRLLDVGKNTLANGQGTHTPYFYIDNAGNAVVLGKITGGGIIKPGQYTTGTEPAYEAGAVYYNTTLGKLRIGGATAWETITSV